MSVRTEGDKVDTNLAGILQFGKNIDGLLEALHVSKITNDHLFELMEELIREQKITNKHLECLTNESFSLDDL